MAGEAAEYPRVPKEYHRNLSLSETRRRYQQRSPIDRQLRSDERLPEVWNLCFGWQARTGIKEEIKRPLELYKGLDYLEISPKLRLMSDRIFITEMPDRDNSKETERSSIIRSLNFVSLGLESCYHSSIVRFNKDPVFEIRYNIQENMAFDVEPGCLDLVMMVKHQQPLYSRYSFKEKISTFVVANARNITEEMILEFTGLCKSLAQAIHPFSLHLAMMFDTFCAKSDMIENNLKTLLSIERQILNGSLIAMKLIKELGNYSQELHVLSRDMILLEAHNDRDLSNVRNLLNDMGRLEKEANKLGEEYAIDRSLHEQTSDGLLCLQDFCVDRDRRLKNRKQRVQNLIALLYNLTANRDSITSLRIAEESTKIAHETRRDSNSMKTIATLTMLYLPATFVCSFFGTNFFALDTNGPGRPSFVVCKIWWVYVVTTAPLTLLTFGVWFWWMKWYGKQNRSASV